MIRRTKLLRRTPIKRVSARRQREGRIYRERRLVFLAEHPRCQAYGIIQMYLKNWMPDYEVVPAATDIHHVKRRGKYYLDESTWLAVSRESHDWIHSHPREARQLGLLQ